MKPRILVRAVAALALATVGLPILQGATPAAAAAVSVDYTCASSVFGIDVVEGPQSLSIDLGLPLNVGDGGAAVTAPLVIGDSLANFPFAVPDVQVSTQLSLAVHEQGGGLISTPTGVGAAGAPVDVGPNAELALNWPADMLITAGSLTSGDFLEVRPGPIVLQYSSSDAEVDGTTVTCTPDVPSTVLVTASIFATDNNCVAQPSCNVVQKLDVGVVGTPQGLTLRELDNNTDFGSLQTAPVAQQLSAALDEVEVQDVRGSDLGWSLTAFAATDFQGTVNASASIPSNALALDSACNVSNLDMDGDPVGNPASGSICTPGSAGVLSSTGAGNSVTLATSNNSPSGTGGNWRIPIDGTLTVPAYQPADSYVLVLTVVLTSN